MPARPRWLELSSEIRRGDALPSAWDADADPLLLFDDEGALCDANPSARALLGLTPEHLPGAPWDDPEWRAEAHRVLVLDPATPGPAAGLAAEHAEEHRFTARADEHDPRRLHLIHVSPSVERLLGRARPAAKRLEDAWFAGVHPDDRDLARRALRDAAAGFPTTVVYRLLSPSGRVRWVRSRNERRVEDGVVYVDGTLADVTALRLGEEELLRFRAIVEASDSCIALLDADWHVRWMNGPGLRMLGLAEAEAIGMPYSAFLTDEGRRHHHDVVLPAVDGQGRWAGETTIHSERAPGRALHVEATSSAIAHPAQPHERLGVVAVLRDVSRLHHLAREHEAIGNLATTIAGGADRETIFASAAREAARLLDADAGATAMLRDDHAERVGEWSATPAAEARLRVGVAAIAATAGTAAAAPIVAAGEDSQCIGAPVEADGRLWGFVVACRPHPAFEPEDRRSLDRLAGLVGTAVGVAAARDALVRQATTDGLTGLYNHRAFHDRLRAEVARAHRYERPLAVVVVDLDGFKEVNDRAGHQVGDDLLRVVGSALSEVLRATETVARLGGDEFALLLPETDVEGAKATAERVRAAVAALSLAIEHGVTASAGLADVTQAASAEELVRLADGALYLSKVQGRNRVSAYDPERLEALSERERAERLVRTHALGAVRVLARLVDLKDASTHGHSERVGELSLRLGQELGWSEDRRVRLRDAALVHDVGKLVVPVALLTKPGALTDAERQLMRRHALTSAQIAAEALSGEQARWVGEQHERPDGTGYPIGLRGEDISDGARILAVADAWDVMTVERPYKPAARHEDALAELRALSGRQFDAEVVAAFGRLWADGRVDLP